ncbi:ABC transporter ATP-binding protein [Lacipirellula parvula]|uniref:Efflux ABC transporter n=1 Tax=Lacipirellula parvula TaxID=2650471 RepID=A0A5K7XBP1_9BACT|nr:ABC transporter ATP-binding protein [Lacipirellula parvula]BBO31723.1 efflux ABC transporter [Lacipirellula parvula]
MSGSATESRGNEKYAIELQGVCKSFRRTQVLSNLSLRVERGKTFAFLGRNGAGKTTSIRMLLGLMKCDQGEVRVLGLDPANEPLEVRARVGYLAEDQQMYGWMRVEEIIRFVAPFYATWDHDLALKYVREFELPLRTKIKHLSKGQNVRLGLLLALAHRPELVILDDPALGLDPVMRRQFNQDLISHLQGEGRTVFYSSHLLYEVEPVADEVAILDGGRLVRQADTETLRRDVKQFVVDRTAYGRIREDMSVLELRCAGEDVAVTVQNASAVRALLDREGIGYRVNDLNLDEIFAAYVAGKVDDEARVLMPLDEVVTHR